MSGRSARTINPGQTDRIKVSIPTRNRSGLMTRTIRVTTNDAGNRTVRLQCSGRVKRPFGGHQPVVSFGAVKRTMPFVKKTIKLTRGNGGPIKPEIGKIERPGIAAELRTIREGSYYELDVTLTPPWPNGRINTFFPIRTGVPQAPVDHVRVAANVEPRVRTAPSRFTVPLRPKAASAASVSVFWANGVDSRVTKARPNDPRLSARVDERGGTQTVVLSVPADYVANRPVVVTLHTTDSEISTFSVPIQFDRPGRSARRKSTRRSPLKSAKSGKCETSADPPPNVAGTRAP